MTPTAMAAALHSYARPCKICRDRDAVHAARGATHVPDTPAVCDECAEDMPVEITGRRA